MTKEEREKEKAAKIESTLSMYAQINGGTNTHRKNKHTIPAPITLDQIAPKEDKH